MIWLLLIPFAPLLGIFAIYAGLLVGARTLGRFLVWIMGDLSDWCHKGVKL